ncbi:hypothetical protein HY439_00055 [Candidatus Microgenomates bacterium]|nr:hypothetical protein [Candidatus Microgenomates bacterium]
MSKIKISVSFLILLTFVTILANPVFAEDGSTTDKTLKTQVTGSTTTNRNPDIKVKLRELNEARTSEIRKLHLALDQNWATIGARYASIAAKLKLLRENRATDAAERKEKRDEKKMRNVQEWAERVVKRDKAALERLTNILIRIESRAEKMKAKRLDTTVIDQKIDTAQLKLKDASNTVSLAEATFQTLATSDNPKEAFQIAKEAQANVKEAFKDIHQALRDIVILIKSSEKGEE